MSVYYKNTNYISFWLCEVVFYFLTIERSQSHHRSVTLPWYATFAVLGSRLQSKFTKINNNAIFKSKL